MHESRRAGKSEIIQRGRKSGCPGLREKVRPLPGPRVPAPPQPCRRLASFLNKHVCPLTEAEYEGCWAGASPAHLSALLPRGGGSQSLPRGPFRLGRPGSLCPGNSLLSCSPLATASSPFHPLRPSCSLALSEAPLQDSLPSSILIIRLPPRLPADRAGSRGWARPQRVPQPSGISHKDPPTSSQKAPFRLSPRSPLLAPHLPPGLLSPWLAMACWLRVLC